LEPYFLAQEGLRTARSFLNATSQLEELLGRAIDDAQFAGFSTSNSSFSVAITSFAAPENDSVLWDYHHLAPERDFNGTNRTTSESQYLIASISKVFTDLLVLESGLDLHAPITEYLSELNGSPGIQWSQITIENLVDHLSGIPQNYGFPEIFSLVPLYQQLGFPPLTTSDFPSCGVIGLTPSCNETSLLEALASSNVTSIFPPSYSPAYNNLGFALLGFMLERHTNQTYSNMKATAREFEYNYQKLRRRWNGIPSKIDYGGHNKRLSDEQEIMLCNWLTRLDKLGISARPTMLTRAANNALRRNYPGLTPPPTVSHNWTSRFLQRHPEFVKKKKKPLAVERAQAHSRQTIQAHFDRFQNAVQEYGIADNDIYNFDETGFRIGIGRPHEVITRRRVRNLPLYLQDPDNRESLTSIEYISAGGQVIPPMVIVTGKVLSEKDFPLTLPGSYIMGISESRYTNDQLTMD
jgi:Beta-lactamase/Tc5 transposase DNA-binding domain